MVHVDADVSRSGGPGVPVRFLVDSGLNRFTRRLRRMRPRLAGLSAA